MIQGTTRVAAVIGWPVEHSRSPQMFAAGFAARAIDAVMIPIGVPPEGLAQVVGALGAMRALGASVTLPHKLAVAALCDELSPAARAIGAVNCLQVDGRRLVGHNTDAPGFSDALIASGFAPAGKRCVILGAGGAARAVAYGLGAAQAGAIEVIARTPEQVTWTAARPWQPAELATCFAGAELVVDATPIGLGDGDLAAVDALPLDALPAAAWVATLVYHRRPRLLERASERGLSTVDGRGMLVHQGARAFAIWTGASPPIEAMQRALDHALGHSLHGT
ncbi:MAG TPA: shikimate dehydrogenase [Kofleriaceae bacterium]|jgi:shikimate dehydrogenase|nr:shikimate dehydrogenase [Kofleriaceae bacterium]